MSTLREAAEEFLALMLRLSGKIPANV